MKKHLCNQSVKLQSGLLFPNSTRSNTPISLCILALQDFPHSYNSCFLLRVVPYVKWVRPRINLFLLKTILDFFEISIFEDEIRMRIWSILVDTKITCHIPSWKYKYASPVLFLYAIRPLIKLRLFSNVPILDRSWDPSSELRTKSSSEQALIPVKHLYFKWLRYKIQRH